MRENKQLTIRRSQMVQQLQSAPIKSWWNRHNTDPPNATATAKLQLPQKPLPFPSKWNDGIHWKRIIGKYCPMTRLRRVYLLVVIVEFVGCYCLLPDQYHRNVWKWRQVAWTILGKCQPLCQIRLLESRNGHTFEHKNNNIKKIENTSWLFL